MAAGTVSSTKIFGAPGMTCPLSTMKMESIDRAFDFGVTEVADNAAYEFLAIPKGFLITGIAVEQTKLTAADVALTFKLMSQYTTDADTGAVGGTFTLDEATLLRSYQDAKSSTAYAAASSGGSVTSAISIPSAIFCSAADVLCMCVPDGLSSDKCAAGAFKLRLLGYRVFGESLGDVASTTPAWAEGQTSAQAADNTSGGDPMFVG